MNCAPITVDCNDCARDTCRSLQKFVLELGVKHAAYVYKLEDNLKQLGSTYKELTLLKDKVMGWVRQAELQDMQRFQNVEVWFRDAACWRAKGTVLLAKGSDLLQEREQRQTLCLGGSRCTNYCSTYAFGGEVSNCLGELTGLITTGNNFEQDKVAGQNRWFSPKSDLRSETAHNPPVGLDAKLRDVVSYLDEGDWMVGVYGKVGVGKTTFLKQIKEHYTRLPDFHVIWIEPRKDCNEEMIQQAIREEIGLLNDWKYESVKEKADYISMELKKKKFVLLLDGITRPINLRNSGVPNRHDLNGSKVVFTTRNKDVCYKVEPAPEKKVSIETLNDGEALKLFQREVGQNATINSRISDHAKTVSEKCDGLPYALVKIGEIMRSKTSPDEWKAMTKFFQNPANDSKTGDKLFSGLRCSYDDLPGENHKACFLYCALFPAGFEIPRGLLKELWILEDFWIDTTDCDSPHYATEILRTLIDASLLEERCEGVKMHQVFRTMALWLARQDTLVVTGMQSEDPKAEKFGGMKRLLLMETDIVELPKVPASACGNLLTLFITSNKDLCKISPGFFRSMAKLTVLNLSHSSLEELPTDISRLVSLKYLDVSFTKITKLPRTLKTLVKLKYFNVNGLKLEFERAKEVMSNLSCLEVLKIICSYSYGEGAGQEDEEELLRLQNLQNVNVLEIAVGSLSALKILFHTQKLLKKTQRLRLRGFKVSQCVGVSLSEHTERLVELSLIECEFKELKINFKSNLNSSATERSIYNITRVAVDKCDYLLDLSCLVLLPYLQVLEVANCLKLGEIISEEKFKEIVEDNDIQNLFPDLTTLHLKSLPELKLISSNKIPFKSLNQLRVERCQKLTRLPFRCRKVDEDKIQFDATQDWWDAIEWEDKDAKPAFLRVISTSRR